MQDDPIRIAYITVISILQFLRATPRSPAILMHPVCFTDTNYHVSRTKQTAYQCLMMARIDNQPCVI